MITLTSEQAHTLLTFCEAFDLRTTGCWLDIKDEMQIMGIEDPESSLEDAKQVLMNG